MRAQCMLPSAGRRPVCGWGVSGLFLLLLRQSLPFWLPENHGGDQVPASTSFLVLLSWWVWGQPLSPVTCLGIGPVAALDTSLALSLGTLAS